MADKILTCKQCNSKFYFTEKDQRFYKDKGYNLPKLCPNCRKNKNNKPKSKYVPRACTTCYFRDFKWDAYGRYTYYCRRTNKNLVNDAPCKHWTKKH